MSTAILDAVLQEDLSKVRELLANQVNVNVQDESGRTPLMIAVQKNHYEMAKLLLDNGADLNMRDNTLLTPWLCSGANGFHDILKLALSYGPKIKDVNRFGGTVLLPSSEKGYLRTVEIALEAGVPVNHVNDLGWSALQEAVVLGNDGYLYREIIKKLLAKGADVHLKDNEGKTALDWAKALNNPKVMRLLETTREEQNDEIRALLSAEKFDEVIQNYGNTTNLEELFFVGHAYTLKKEFERALEVFRKGACLDGTSTCTNGTKAEFLFYSANVLRNMKRADEALAEYDKAIEAAKEKYAFYLYHKSNYLRELGKHEEAVAAMDRLLSEDPKRYDYLFHKANSLRSLGRHEEAIAAMDEAISIDKQNPLYVFHKAQSLALLKRYDQAVPLFEQVVAKDSRQVYVDALDQAKKALSEAR